MSANLQLDMQVLKPIFDEVHPTELQIKNNHKLRSNYSKYFEQYEATLEFSLKLLQ